jgi:hypothetical protein
MNVFDAQLSINVFVAVFRSIRQIHRAVRTAPLQGGGGHRAGGAGGRSGGAEFTQELRTDHFVGDVAVCDCCAGAPRVRQQAQCFRDPNTPVNTPLSHTTCTPRNSLCRNSCRHARNPKAVPSPQRVYTSLLHLGIRPGRGKRGQRHPRKRSDGQTTVWGAAETHAHLRINMCPPDPCTFAQHIPVGLRCVGVIP